jgi:anthranilate phosphoribosyltransferase
MPGMHPHFIERVVAYLRFGSTLNLVGPLLNPTMPAYKVIGVPSVDAIGHEAQILRELGFRRAFVMHGLAETGDLGMDELSTLGPNHIAELMPDGSIIRSVITPEELGVRRARFEDVASSRDVHREALTLLRVIAGRDAGPRQDIACLNAAPLLTVMGRAEDLRDGIAQARGAIEDGRALDKLARLGELAEH